MDCETILNYATGETLIFTFTNAGYCDFVRNMIKSVQKSESDWRVVVFCLDQLSIDTLTPYGITCVPFFKEVSSDLRRWGEIEFKQVAVQKLAIFDVLLNLLENSTIKYLLYLDSDIVVFKDCLSYLISEIKDYEVLFQCDESKLFCSNPKYCPNLCTGFIFMRVNKNIQKAFFYDSQDYLLPGQDQLHINRRLRKLGSRFPKSKTLSKQYFPNGILRDHCLPNKYILHYNYLYSEQKKSAMVNHGHWFI